MRTERVTNEIGFESLGKREVVGDFDGGKSTVDAGGLLLRETEVRLGISKRLAGFFTDDRRADRIEPDLASLVALVWTSMY